MGSGLVGQVSAARRQGAGAFRGQGTFWLFLGGIKVGEETLFDSIKQLSCSCPLWAAGQHSRIQHWYFRGAPATIGGAGSKPFVIAEPAMRHIASLVIDAETLKAIDGTLTLALEGLKLSRRAAPSLGWGPSGVFCREDISVMERSPGAARDFDMDAVRERPRNPSTRCAPFSRLPCSPPAPTPRWPSAAEGCPRRTPGRLLDERRPRPARASRATGEGSDDDNTPT